MPETKKYLSKISKGGLTLHLKDLEARESLSAIPSTYATKQELEDAEVASMFQLYVDPTDLHLKGKKTGYGTFEVVDGHLILHQTE